MWRNLRLIASKDLEKILTQLNNLVKIAPYFILSKIPTLYAKDILELEKSDIYKFITLIIKDSLQSFATPHILLGAIPQLKIIYCNINEKIVLDLSNETNGNELKQIIYTPETINSNTTVILQEKIKNSLSKVPQIPKKLLYGVPWNPDTSSLPNCKTKINILYVYYPYHNPILANTVSINQKEKSLEFLYNYITFYLEKAFEFAQSNNYEDAIINAWLAIEISIGFQEKANNIISKNFKRKTPIKKLKALYSKEKVTNNKPFLSEDILNKLEELYNYGNQILHGQNINTNIEEVRNLLMYVTIYYNYFFSYNDFNLILQIAQDTLKANDNPFIAKIIPYLIKPIYKLLTLTPIQKNSTAKKSL